MDPNSKTSGQWNRVDPIYRYVTSCFRQQNDVDWRRCPAIYFAGAFEYENGLSSTPTWDLAEQYLLSKVKNKPKLKPDV